MTSRERRRRVAWLENVWRKSETVPGLTLAEPDFIVLALELAVREVGAWKTILDEQHARIQNPDRKAQFEFVVPALSADVRTRAAFFERLRDVKNRGREAWVLQGLNYLHHPLRAASSEGYIPTESRARAARFSGRATSSSRSGGWTRRSAGISPRAPRLW